MKGSGKQVLLKVLYDLSTHVVPDDALGEANRRLRTGLLLHGSTAEESFEHASRLTWRTDSDQDGPWRQGTSTQAGIFVSDIFETLLEMPGLEEFLSGRYPTLSPEDFDAATWFMWLLLSGVQMFTRLNTVEVEQGVDVDAWVAATMKHYEHHFRERGEEPPK